MSDLVVSYLRTIVPVLWGALLTWALGAISWLPDVLAFLHLDPQSAGVVTAVTGLVVAAWYVVWRKVEPLIPSWLTTIVLGAAKAPTYDPGAVVLADGRTVREANADAAVAGVDNGPSRTPFTEPH